MPDARLTGDMRSNHEDFSTGCQGLAVVSGVPTDVKGGVPPPGLEPWNLDGPGMFAA